jgi:hypothetical protein
LYLITAIICAVQAGKYTIVILLPKFKQSSRLPTWLPDARDISKTGFKQVKIMKEFD